MGKLEQPVKLQLRANLEAVGLRSARLFFTCTQTISIDLQNPASSPEFIFFQESILQLMYLLACVEIPLYLLMALVNGESDHLSTSLIFNLKNIVQSLAVCFLLVSYFCLFSLMIVE